MFRWAQVFFRAKLLMFVDNIVMNELNEEEKLSLFIEKI